MDLRKLISELEAERDRLDEAIRAFERLAAAKGQKRQVSKSVPKAKTNPKRMLSSLESEELNSLDHSFTS